MSLEYWFMFPVAIVVATIAMASAAFAVDLVHPYILGADSLGNSCHDSYPAA